MERESPNENVRQRKDPSYPLSELLQQIREENITLQRHLEHVLATAAANERIWQHFVEIERVLFRTRDINLLAEELLREIRHRFTPDHVILFISHPELLEHHFHAISSGSGHRSEGTWILPLSTQDAFALMGSPPQPCPISHEDMDAIAHLLPEEASSLRSGVLIPLSIHDLVFGGLFLGSLRADRYHPQAATDLLEQLGMKIALCMDNCLSYEKVKEFAIQDPVTGLLNFFQIHTVLEKQFRRAQQVQQPLSVMLIEPRFHSLTDEPTLGNAILKHVAGVLRDTLPQGDCHVGRYGSDQFLVVLPNVSRDEAEEAIPYLAQVLRKAPFQHSNTAILIQTIAGIGALDERTRQAQDLIDAACNELCRRKMSQPHASS